MNIIRSIRAAASARPPVWHLSQDATDAVKDAPTAHTLCGHTIGLYTVENDMAPEYICKRCKTRNERTQPDPPAIAA